jgi:hypothetical protein
MQLSASLHPPAVAHPSNFKPIMPLPLSIISYAIQQCKAENTNCSLTIADMISLGFFFLLRSGECAKCQSAPMAPFRMKDVHLFLGPKKLDTLKCTDDLLRSVTGAALEFHSKKNGNQGQLISLPMTGDPQWCPVLTLANRIHHLHQQSADLETPLYDYKEGPNWKSVTTTAITTRLHAGAISLGYSPEETRNISISSLRASGNLDLEHRGVEPFLIEILRQH